MRMQRARVALVAASIVTGVGSADVVELQSTNPELEGHFGSAVSGIPDCDGDGVDDVIVGAEDEDGGGVTDAGRVYIFSGASGALIRAHSSPNDTNGGNYGNSVAGVPDLNGDGRGDYVVGAPNEAGPGGRVYVYSGASGALLRTHVSPNAEGGGKFGFSVAAAPDLTGDGRGDYVVGAPDEDNGATTNAGRIYVYSGNTGNLVRSHNSPNAESFGQFGFAVAGIPDVNNDNRGDYVVGAPFEDPGAQPSDSGKAYVYNGSTGALLHSLTSGEPDSGGRFGFSVAGLPDVGGNGFGDVLVGAPYETLEQSGDDFFQAGFAYLFSGTSGALAQTFSEPVENQQTDGYFGYGVGGIRDMDGDGLAEMIIGAPGWPSYNAYVYNGGSPYTLKESRNTPDDLGANQFWGAAVAGVGDATGDGRGDYIIAGQGSDDFPTGPSETGRAYLYRAVYNDGCGTVFSNLPTLQLGDNAVTTVGAAEGSAEDDCTQFADPGPDVWYRYVASCTGTATFSTCGQANWNTKIAAYQGCTYSAPFFLCNLETLLGCNDNGLFCSGGTSRLTIDVVEGDCYFIRLGGAGGTSGVGTLTVTQDCAGCVADLNGDTVVNGADLSILLGNWGGAGAGDLNDDNVINGADLSILLGAWGPC
ncbi:MAG: FG-GAP repeat protein [Phycisphaerae bacterium]|nr:FG-GAP repeat protein [Phycisphaerae bacterium]